MRRLILPLSLLELYAFGLAWLHMSGGVVTDEAKYLLSIPYPHPPLLRSLFASLSWFSGQEFFWRLVIASALVQSVWFLWDLGSTLAYQRRVALAGLWLVSSALILQAGSIMMAPLTGLFGLACVWFALRQHPLPSTWAPFIGCLWFFALFSAYQTVLYLPLLISALLSMNVSYKKIVFLLGIPLVLLVCYTLSNPLILASMSTMTAQDAPVAMLFRLGDIAWIGVLAGSILMTIGGIIGIFMSRRVDFITTLIIVFVFITLHAQEYYAILLTPIFAAGAYFLFCNRRIFYPFFLPLHFAMSIGVVLFVRSSITPTPARETMQFLAGTNITGLVLIDGPFGHEWQYESVGPIRRYTSEISSAVENEAKAIVCTKESCEEDMNLDEWKRLEGAPLEIWIKR